MDKQQALDRVKQIFEWACTGDNCYFGEKENGCQRCIEAMNIVTGIVEDSIDEETYGSAED